MNNTIRFIMLLFCLTPAFAENNNFSIEDYAWKAEITESSETLQRIDLTIDILQGLSHSNAADIAVFDAKGQRLPGMLRQKSSVSTNQQSELTFHRFSRDDYAGSGGTLSIEQQQIDPQNNQINRYSYQQQLSMKEHRSDYIIELNDSQLKQGITDIELEWIHQPASDFLKLKVQVANNLDQWRTIQSDKNLFNADGRTGEWITLTGLPSNYRYIRLLPHQDVSSFELVKATGTYSSSESVDDLVFKSNESLVEENKHEGFYAFQQPLQVNAKSMKFVLPQGYFLSGKLYAGDDGFDKKRLITSSFEQHNVANIAQSSAIKLSAYRYKNWWLEVDKPINMDISLEFHYSPYELFFINNQQGPFTLAWGNYEAQSNGDELSAMLRKQPELDYAKATMVNFADKQKAGGFHRLTETPEKPWLTWVLWMAMIIAVMVTIRMAYSLYRDMNR